MNGQNLNNNSLYRANRNLNTAIETPEFNVGNAMEVNIKNDVNNNYFNQVNSNNNFNYNDSNSINTDNNNYNNQVGNNWINSNINYTNVSNNSLNNSFNINNSTLSNEINVNNNSNSFINNNTIGMNEEEQQVIYDMSIMGSNIINNDFENKETNNSEVTYIPTGNDKKKKVSFGMPEELKLIVVLAFVILIFMFVMPNIYDFIRDIKLTIFG